MREVKFSEVLKQYKIYHFVEDNTEYRQVTISMHTGVSFRGTKLGKDIGRKRQFVIDLEEYPNTFIFTRQGVQNGSYGIAPKEVHGCVVTENMPMFSIEPTLNPEYLEYYLQTNHFQEQLQALNASGSAQKSIHEKVLLQLNILLPDIKKQKSIVDEIKSVENKQSKVLEELQTQSELIIKLRSSILSDAVSGKLVPQDSNDENAEVLLEKIKVEKEKLTKAGKIKKAKPLPPISENEIPYQLPDGWVWCRLESILEFLNGDRSSKYPSGADIKEHGIPFINSKTIVDNQVNFNSEHMQFITEDKFLNLNGGKAINNDLIMVLRGASYGKVGIFKESHKYKTGFINAQLLILRTFLIFNINFLLLFFKSKLFIDNLNKIAAGSAQPHFSANNLSTIVIPIAPLEEQKRIVAKVEKLMATCDALELGVQNSKRETEKLMQSVLKEAFKNGK